ncbi:hypothetical protein KQX54_020003 [Cotesia glomerata]|uniref:Uncharacterized protein n=1 Tax=Cotesia glomerata TaxID=32391 RepID=A0AAV7IZM1_COTGL|nr:hypothetical protein KQX54_020003 [Cotesia glomerata]
MECTRVRFRGSIYEGEDPNSSQQEEKKEEETLLDRIPDSSFLGEFLYKANAGTARWGSNLFVCLTFQVGGTSLLRYTIIHRPYIYPYSKNDENDENDLNDV